MILPIIGTVVELLRENRETYAEESGVEPAVIDKVGEAIQIHLTKDERQLQRLALEIQNARDFAVQTQVKGHWLVDLARGLVRPVITFTAMGWYVFARVNDIALQPEDYAIVGGILAFWFGMRPFEKVKIEQI